MQPLQTFSVSPRACLRLLHSRSAQSSELPSNTSSEMPHVSKAQASLLRPGRGQELFQFSVLKTLPGFVSSLIPQNTTAAWNHSVLKWTIASCKDRVTSSCCRQRKTGASEKASIKSVIKCKVQHHVAFRFHFKLSEVFSGAGRNSPSTYEQIVYCQALVLNPISI